MTSGKRNLVKPAAASAWLKSTAALAVAGAVLLWMAFPPVGMAWLAWVAPLPWLLLIRREELLGRRAYLILWLAGLVHWLAMLQGIRLAHWLNHFGWLTLSAYLAVYLPVFVGLTRVAVHAWRLPLLVAAPVVWVGLELLRGHLYEHIKSSEDLAGIVDDPIPNRHAVVHGLVSYKTAQSSINAMILTLYIFQMLSVYLERDAKEASLSQ